MWKIFEMLIFLMVLCAQHRHALADGKWGKWLYFAFLSSFCQSQMSDDEFFYFYLHTYYTIACRFQFICQEKNSNVRWLLNNLNNRFRRNRHCDPFQTHLQKHLLRKNVQFSKAYQFQPAFLFIFGRCVWYMPWSFMCGFIRI